MARGPVFGPVHSRQGGVRACTFQDSGQFLLPRVLRQYTSEPISKQKWRAEFLGGSGPRLIEQVVSFRFYFDSSVLSCMLVVAYPAMPQLVAYVQFPGEKILFSAGLICGRVEQPQSTPAQAWLASVPAAVLWQQ